MNEWMNKVTQPTPKLLFSLHKLSCRQLIVLTQTRKIKLKQLKPATQGFVKIECKGKFTRLIGSVAWMAPLISMIDLANGNCFFFLSLTHRVFWPPMKSHSTVQQGYLIFISMIQYCEMLMLMLTGLSLCSIRACLNFSERRARVFQLYLACATRFSIDPLLTREVLLQLFSRAKMSFIS